MAMWITGVMYVLAGLMFMGLSIPLIQKRVKPNYWYGFRTSKTLKSEQIWYAVNWRGGVLLFIAGAIIAAGAVLLAPLALLLRIGAEGYTIGCLILMVAAVTWATIATFQYMRRW